MDKKTTIPGNEAMKRFRNMDSFNFKLQGSEEDCDTEKQRLLMARFRKHLPVQSQQ